MVVCVALSIYLEKAKAVGIGRPRLNPLLANGLLHAYRLIHKATIFSCYIARPNWLCCT